MLQHSSNPKQALLNQMLADFPVVQIHFDGRHKQAKLPHHLAENPHVVFDLGLALPTPIRDFTIDSQGVYGTFSFNFRPASCFVPWAAVFAAVNKSNARGALWQADVPDEVKRAAERPEAISQTVIEIDERAARQKRLHDSAQRPNPLRLIK